MEKKFYITTAIDYVNAPTPHVGHALEKVQADVLARYHRSLGEDVFFLTGTDENAQKNILAAEKAGVPAKQFIDQNVNAFKKMIKLLNISNNDFIRTTDQKKHWPGAIKLWTECNNAGDIYKKDYEGLYCIGCAAFVTKKDLKNGLCPEHLKEPEKISEQNYFFKLSKYEKQLQELIETDKLKIVPEKSKNEILSFIKSGLRDFSISRPSERMKGWGIDVPGDLSQKIWVWYDALSNYITALGYGTKNENNFEKYWPADVHVIGKGITRFHSLFWIAMLISAGLKLPKTIFVHDYLTVNGQKISKTLGNVIDPIKLVEKYGTDSVRYFLLREFSPFHDGDFTYERFEQRYESDLAKGLGNLVSRVLTMVEKYCDNKVPKIDKDPDTHPLRVDEKIYNWKKAWKDLDKYLGTFQFNEALTSIWRFIKEADKYIEQNKPWDLAKQGKTKQLNWALYGLLDAIHQIAWQVYIFMPETAAKIAEILKIEKLLIENPLNKDSWANIQPGIQLGKTELLFPKLE